MKTINIHLEDKEYNELKEYKDNNSLTWKEMLLLGKLK